MLTAHHCQSRKRVAARRADDKIKPTLEEISHWSDNLSDSKSTVCHLGDFHELPCKKLKVQPSPPLLFVDDDGDASTASGADGSVSKSKPGKSGVYSSSSGDTITTIDDASCSDYELSFDSDTSVAGSELEEGEYLCTAAERARHAERVKARQQHSPGSMIFSRRLSYKLVMVGADSPVYSPIAAVSLARYY